jgi:acyl-CoA synthetase (NDP forming)
LPPTDDASSWYATVVKPVKDELRNPLVFLGHLSAAASAPQMAELREMGVPVLMGTETGLRAARHVLEYSAFQRTRGLPAGTVSEGSSPENRLELRQKLQSFVGSLDEHDSKQVLSAYGLTPTREIRAAAESDVLRAAEEIGYPVALKTCADQHKTERGGVRLDLANSEILAAAYADFVARLGPEVLVQEMVPAGTELILGAVHDPQFGPMLTLGTGGIFVEVLDDVSMLTLPTTPDAVRAALSGLKGASLLAGARGRPPADLDAVVQAAMGLGALALDLGDLIAEIDVNPLVALPDRAVVVDALIVLLDNP